MRGLPVDDALRVKRPSPAPGAIRGHPHAPVFSQQREVRSGSKRLAAEIERKARSQHVIPLFQQVLYQLEEPGIAWKELHFIERNHLKATARQRFLFAQKRPQFAGRGSRNLLRGILIALATLDAAHAAARIGTRLEYGYFLVAVLPQGIDLGKQMARFAGRHIADE